MTRPTNIIKVTLDASVTPPVLEVQDHGRTHVDRKPTAQILRWQLNGPVAQGSFVAFEWITPPQPGIFGTAVIEADGNALEITDTNNSDASTGEWSYRLRVSYDGQIYETASGAGATQSVGAMLAAKEPIIINR